MIALPTWLVVMLVLGLFWLGRRILIAGRVQGFRYCLHSVVVVADAYAKNPERRLEPHEQDVAEALDVALPDLIEGYTRQQAAKIEGTLP